MDINTNDYIPLEVIEQFLEYLPFEVPRAIELLEYRVKPPRQHTKTTHTYSTRLKRLIFYLDPIFNKAVLDWQTQHFGSMRRVLWRAIFRELVFQLSNYAKSTEFILDREFPVLWNEIEHIQTSIPHLGLLETLRHKFLTNLLNESKFTPSHTNVRVYDELRRNVLPLPFEVPIAEIARKLAMEADIELWLTQVEGMIFYQNRYKKMRRLVWTLLNKDPGLLADAFLYSDRAGRAYPFFSYLSARRIIEYARSVLENSGVTACFAEFRKFFEAYKICPCCGGCNHEGNLYAIYFNPEFSVYRNMLVTHLENPEKFSQIRVGIPCCSCYNLIQSEDDRGLFNAHEFMRRAQATIT